MDSDSPEIPEFLRRRKLHPVGFELVRLGPATESEVLKLREIEVLTAEAVRLHQRATARLKRAESVKDDLIADMAERFGLNPLAGVGIDEGHQVVAPKSVAQHNGLHYTE